MSDADTVQRAEKQMGRIETILRDLVHAARSAKQSLRRKAQALESAALHRGLSKLPDELLACILERAADDSDTYLRLTPVYLSHVCRRFRQVMLTLPMLWSSLEDRFSLSRTKEYLIRSKVTPLSIAMDMSSIGSSRDPTPFLHAIFPHASRWGNIHISTASHAVVDGTADVGLQSLNMLSEAGLVLPALKHLRLEHQSHQYGWANRTTDGREHFYAAWKMPALTTLEIVGFLPQPCIAPSLASCTVRLPKWNRQWHPTSLIPFIGSLSSITDLTLEFGPIRASQVALFEQTIPQLGVVRLDNLQALSLATKFDRSLAINSFTDLIRTPNLTKLAVHMDFVSGYHGPMLSADEWLQSVLRHNPSHLVEEFSIYIDTSQTMHQSGGLPLERVFRQFPLLRHLAVELPFFTGICPTLAEIEALDNFPPLRTLRLKNCTTLEGVVVRKLIYKLRRGACWDEFERLELINCLSMSKGEIEKVLPKGKLLWRNDDYNG